ncbi:MAG: hypothetical protein IKA83_08795 [Paludibacteraceae bacterium]|nr:hypothetical protein [Paludibacteraceae bacterium]
MAYNSYNKTVTTTTADGRVVTKKVYYGGSIGPWDDEEEEEIEETAIPDTPGSSKSKVIIWGALIAAALFLFK